MDSVQADVFTEAAVMNSLSGSADSRYGIIKRALKRGEIVRLKRGLYMLGPKLRRKGINLFQLAQMVYGPSYISLESALAHHRWIPEGVFSVTSVSARRSKEVKTPLGVFSYAHIPSNDFWAGVERVEMPGGIFLMATPWRALTDYVHVHNLTWKGLEPVVESLRVDPECFKTGSKPLLRKLEKATRSERVLIFLRGIRKELGL
jgi:predicted transcriptional regulator of viral defense system